MKITEWLISVDARDMEPSDFIDELTARLRSLGYPVDYAVFSVLNMHPDLLADNLIWSADEGTKIFSRAQRIVNTNFFMKSPVYQIFKGDAGFRQRLTNTVLEFDFPVLHELKDSNYTDYMIEALQLTKKIRSYITFATKSTNGFTDEQFHFLKSLSPCIAAVIAQMSARSSLKGLLSAYLGHHAGELVRSGLFHKGDGFTIDSVIWFSDLRGFTEYTDKNGATAALERLNKVFNVIGNEIQAHNGDILKFIGDAVLAIFPIQESDSANVIARSALDTARNVLNALEVINRTEETPMRLGIGLHRGVVNFGNIGSDTRLDFTVIGTPVNETSRIESLCKTLGEDILLSDEIAELIGKETLRSLGKQTLRGVSNQRELFGV